MKLPNIFHSDTIGDPHGIFYWLIVAGFAITFGLAIVLWLVQGHA